MSSGLVARARRQRPPQMNGHHVAQAALQNPAYRSTGVDSLYQALECFAAPNAGAFHRLKRQTLSLRFIVIAGLVPAIHLAAGMDHRVLGSSPRMARW